MKYTDPLLLTNNEDIDQSDLNDNLNKFLEIFNSSYDGNNENIQKVQNFVKQEEPVDLKELSTEISKPRQDLKNTAASMLQGYLKKKAVENEFKQHTGETPQENIVARVGFRKLGERMKAKLAQNDYESKKTEAKKTQIGNRLAESYRTKQNKDLYEAYRDVYLREEMPDGTVRKRTQPYTLVSDDYGVIDIKPNNKEKSAKILQGALRGAVQRKKKPLPELDTSKPEGKQFDGRYFNRRPSDKERQAKRATKKKRD
jgi:hypothetical protein